MQNHDNELFWIHLCGLHLLQENWTVGAWCTLIDIHKTKINTKIILYLLLLWPDNVSGLAESCFKTVSHFMFSEWLRGSSHRLLLANVFYKSLAFCKTLYPPKSRRTAWRLVCGRRRKTSHRDLDKLSILCSEALWVPENVRCGRTNVERLRGACHLRTRSPQRALAKPHESGLSERNL